MAALRKSLWMIAAIVALPVPAAAQDICAALQRIVASAGEPTPFESVRQASAGGAAVLAGFAPEDCTVTAEGVDCDHRSGGGVATFVGWPAPLACNGFVLTEAAERGPNNRDWILVYRAGALRVEYGSACRMCAGPGYSHFTARFETKRRPEE